MIKLTVKKGGGNSSFINNRLFSLIIGFLKPILCRLFCQTQGQSLTTHSFRDCFIKKGPQKIIAKKKSVYLTCNLSCDCINVTIFWVQKCWVYFILEWKYEKVQNCSGYIFIVLCKIRLLLNVKIRIECKYIYNIIIMITSSILVTNYWFEI